MTRRIATAAVVFFIGLLAFTGIAKATPIVGNPSPTCSASAVNCGNVSGSVTIPASLTLTLSANSFNIGINPGATSNTGINPYALTATVQTNDAGGYGIWNVLNAPFASAGTNPSQISPSNMYAYAFGNNASPTSTGTFTTFGSSLPSSVQVVNQGAPSQSGGDTWGQAWQFTIPTNQAPGNYTGTINVTALGN